MSRDIEAVTARWHRRYWPDLLPDTFLYDRMRLAIATASAYHGMRNAVNPQLRRMFRRLDRWTGREP